MRQAIDRRVVHKTCPTWGETRCKLELFVANNPRTSERWRDVTCLSCLMTRPKRKT